MHCNGQRGHYQIEDDSRRPPIKLRADLIKKPALWEKLWIKIDLVLNIEEIPDISYAMLQKFWDDGLFITPKTKKSSPKRAGK